MTSDDNDEAFKAMRENLRAAGQNEGPRLSPYANLPILGFANGRFKIGDEVMNPKEAKEARFAANVPDALHGHNLWGHGRVTEQILVRKAVERELPADPGLGSRNNAWREAHELQVWQLGSQRELRATGPAMVPAINALCVEFADKAPGRDKLPIVVLQVVDRQPMFKITAGIDASTMIQDADDKEKPF